MKAEEILAEVWRQIRDIRGRGGLPARIVISPEAYRLVQEYRAGLGSLENPEMDYLSRHSIFTLPVYVEKDVSPRVEEA